jgi:hypothetical protein
MPPGQSGFSQDHTARRGLSARNPEEPLSSGREVLRYEVLKNDWVNASLGGISDESGVPGFLVSANYSGMGLVQNLWCA